MKRRQVFYPECQWLDPNTRDDLGRFFCEHRCCYVAPQESVYRAARSTWRGTWQRAYFERDACAHDCWHCSGKTRVPTL